MQQDHRPRGYSLSSYDKYLCLRPPLALWLTVIYLSRAVSLPIVIGLSSVAGGSANTTGLVHGMFGPGTLLPGCLAFLVLCALALRTPSAGRVVRWISEHGRALLMVAAALDAGLGLAFAGITLEGIKSADEHLGGALLGIALDMYVLIYLTVSKRVRDVFADFPAADLATK
jgi:hypothetical protein